MMHANVQTITPTDRERGTWRQLAAAAYREGHRGTGHRFNMAAALPGPIARATYDALQYDYFVWLLDNAYPEEGTR